jgi:hypothetical protein
VLLFYFLELTSISSLSYPTSQLSTQLGRGVRNTLPLLKWKKKEDEGIEPGSIPGARIGRQSRFGPSSLLQNCIFFLVRKLWALNMLRFEHP